MSWLEPLIDGSVPAGFAEWARSRPSLKDAWKSCDRADWLFWVAAQIARDERERKHVAVSGAYVARRVRARRVAPLFPTDADIAVLWASSVPRADVREVLNPIVALVVAAPIAFGAMVGVVVALRALGNFVWPIALATFLTVWLPLAMLIQRGRMKRVRARLRAFDWDAARSGVSSALERRVRGASAAQRQALANELRTAIEEPGWLRLV